MSFFHSSVIVTGCFTHQSPSCQGARMDSSLAMEHTPGNLHNLSLHHERSPGHAVHHYKSSSCVHQILQQGQSKQSSLQSLEVNSSETWSHAQRAAMTANDVRSTVRGLRLLRCCIAMAVGWRSDQNQVVIDRPSLMCSPHVISVRKLNIVWTWLFRSVGDLLQSILDFC